MGKKPGFFKKGIAREGKKRDERRNQSSKKAKRQISHKAGLYLDPG